MNSPLAVIALGYQSSGKSINWNALFDSTVCTGSNVRALRLNPAQYVDDVFLVQGSAEERDKTIDVIVPTPLPTIILCSVQYVSEAMSTFDFFFKHGYDVFVQWINPGYHDADAYPDTLALIPRLLTKGATIQQRSGRASPPDDQVQDLRQVMLGLATYRDLVKTDS